MDLFGPMSLPDGIVWDDKYGKWRAFICVDGKEITRGQFNYLESAITVRKNAEARYRNTHRMRVKDLFG